MEILITSVVAFISTNIDDIFILALFYGNSKFKEREVMVGQLLGFAALVVISLIGSLIGFFVSEEYIGLLGLVPIYLGIKALSDSRNETEDEEPKFNGTGHNMITVAGVTIANGADNIGIYIPLFATLTWSSKALMIGVFLVMTVVWCLIAKYFTKHPYVAKVVDRYGHTVTPFVLILLGVYILWESGSVGLIKLL